MSTLFVVLLALVGPVQTEKPNIIVVLTDDQRWDTITPDIMPELNRRIIEHGILYTNAFVTNPLCCPSRAAILSGGYYSHETQVLTNRFENGSAARFLDTKTIAVLAQQQGYLTCFIGKYLNGSKDLTGISPDGEPIEELHYTPPGWNLFASDPILYDWSYYPITCGSSTTNGPQRGIYLPDEVAELQDFMIQWDFGDHLRQYFSGLDFDDLPYISHFYEDSATAFILDAAERDMPFFVFIATRQPHFPAIPERKYRDLFPDFSYRDRAWGEEDLDDKPYYVRKRAEGFELSYEYQNSFAANQLRSLRSVDDMIRKLSQTINSDPKLRDNTWFIFLSDNGYLWGEHKLFTKKLPYEESIRVPLVVQSPNRHSGVNNTTVAADLDTAATVLYLMGYNTEDISQGVPLPLKPKHKMLMCENWRGGTIYEPSWSSIRTNRWKYVHYDTGESELYNLLKDPFELSSVHSQRQRLVDRFFNVLAEQRGLCIMGEGYNDLWEIPSAIIGVYYEWRLVAIGGNGQYEWSIIDDERYVHRRDGYIDRIPDGLSLNASGVISGIPTESGAFEFPVQVIDQSDTLYRGGPQRHADFVRLVVE